LKLHFENIPANDFFGSVIAKFKMFVLKNDLAGAAIAIGIIIFGSSGKCVGFLKVYQNFTVSLPVLIRAKNNICNTPNCDL
jgi:hypothetical protein